MPHKDARGNVMTGDAGSEQDAKTEASSQLHESEDAVGNRNKRLRVWNWLRVLAKAWRRWLLPVVIAGAFIGLGIKSIPDLRNAFSTPVTQANCTPVSPPGKIVEDSSGLRTTSVMAKLRPSQREEVDFGRSITSRSITLYLDLSKTMSSPTYFHVLVNPFTRADDASLQDPGRNIVARAVSDGRTLLLNVCFRRSGNQHKDLGDPGSYVGSVTIDDRRLVAPVTVPITVTMQYPNGVFLLWLYAAAIIPGAWCLWVIKDKPTGTDNALSPKFFKWLITVNGAIAVVAGSVAAFTVYVAVYLRDPTWAATALQVLTLYGAMFSAFVTTAGIASLTAGKTAGQDA
jgi:hypothetical protein